jgi:hypothetical protein
MRDIVIVAAAALALSACATQESVQRQAALNCQAVGISEADPQFGTCTRAYSRAYVEDRLEHSYHDALNATPEDPRIRHQWHGY